MCYSGCRKHLGLPATDAFRESRFAWPPGPVRSEPAHLLWPDHRSRRPSTRRCTAQRSDGAGVTTHQGDPHETRTCSTDPSAPRSLRLAPLRLRIEPSPPRPQAPGTHDALIRSVSDQVGGSRLVRHGRARPFLHDVFDDLDIVVAATSGRESQQKRDSCSAQQRPTALLRAEFRFSTSQVKKRSHCRTPRSFLPDQT